VVLLVLVVHREKLKNNFNLVKRRRKQVRNTCKRERRWGLKTATIPKNIKHESKNPGVKITYIDQPLNYF